MAEIDAVPIFKLNSIALDKCPAKSWLLWRMAVLDVNQMGQLDDPQTRKGAEIY